MPAFIAKLKTLIDAISNDEAKKPYQEFLQKAEAFKTSLESKTPATMSTKECRELLAEIAEQEKTIIAAAVEKIKEDNTDLTTTIKNELNTLANMWNELKQLVNDNKSSSAHTKLYDEIAGHNFSQALHDFTTASATFNTLTPADLSQKREELRKIGVDLRKTLDDAKKAFRAINQPTKWNNDTEKYIAQLLSSDGKSTALKKQTVVLLPIADKEKYLKVAKQLQAQGYEVSQTLGVVPEEERETVLESLYHAVGRGKKICYPAGEASCDSSEFKEFLQFCNGVDHLGGPQKAKEQFEKFAQARQSIQPEYLDAFYRGVDDLAVRAVVNASSSGASVVMPVGEYEKHSQDSQRKLLQAAHQKAEADVVDIIKTATQFSTAKVVNKKTEVQGDVSTTELKIALEKPGATPADPVEKKDVSITVTRTHDAKNNCVKLQCVCNTKGVALDWKAQCEILAKETLELRKLTETNPTEILVAINPPEDKPNRNVGFQDSSGNTVKLTQKEADMIAAHVKAGYTRVGFFVNGATVEFNRSFAATSQSSTLPKMFQNPPQQSSSTSSQGTPQPPSITPNTP